MTAAALLPRLRAAGAGVALRGDKLVLTHASRVPAELMAEARARRADLLDELANDNAEPGDRPFVNDPVERAAIQTEEQPVRRLRKRMTNWAQAGLGDCVMLSMTPQSYLRLMFGELALMGSLRQKPRKKRLLWAKR